MSLHSDMFKSQSAPTMLSFQGDSIAYTPEGGGSKTITAIINRGEQMRYESDMVTTSQKRTATIIVQQSEVQIPKVGRHSLRGDKFYFDDLEWKIIAEPESDPPMRIFVVEANVLVDYDMGSRMK